MKRAVLTIVLAIAAGSAIADQWLPATPQSYMSYLGTYRLTVFPRQISSPMAYFGDKVEGIEPAAQLVDASARCEATLERLVSNHYEELWRQPLVNDVAPVTALVSDRSGAFVTFDNWHTVGCCADTIVIYDASGSVVRKFSLNDLLAKEDIAKLPRTVSSTYWGGEHELGWVRDDEVVNLSVVANGKFPGDLDVDYKTIQIRLRDGAILASSSAPPN